MSGPDPSIVWQRVEEWLSHATEDERIARGCLQFDPPSWGGAAFHCQQAIEKPLKAFMVQASVDFRKTHDLDSLGLTVAAHFPAVEPVAAALAQWTTWSVAYRYPGETGPEPVPSPEELSNALNLIARLADVLRALAPPAPNS
jgi:HEPN domain-containing protein